MGLTKPKAWCSAHDPEQITMAMLIYNMSLPLLAPNPYEFEEAKKCSYSGGGKGAAALLDLIAAGAYEVVDRGSHDSLH